MKLSWYISRLRSMEPAELAHRLAEKSRKIASKQQHQGWDKFPAAPVSSVLPGLAERARAASAGQREAIAEASQAILRGDYAALGQTWPQARGGSVFPPERWRLDPVTGQLWPGSEHYCFDIDFRHDGTRGDIKYVWEFNRLQFLPVLAAQWVLHGGDEPIKAIEQAIGSWHAANPPFGGVGWASGIEVALRAISVILALELAGSRLKAEVNGQAGQILSASQFWLKRFPSHFSSANNHLVAELAGEYLIGQATGQPNLKAWQGLLAELGRQILPDGGGAEQTPTYAAFTAELVLLAALVAREDGTALPQAGAERLAAFHEFLAWTGPHARFGDDDEGRVVTLGSEKDYQASVGSAIAAFMGMSSQLRPAQDFRALLFGRPAQATSSPKGLRVFEQTGLGIWRGQMGAQEAVLRLDHGPLGYLSIAAHGHADALAVTLDLDGEPVLVDPGTYLYGSGGRWRNWFRSTPAHNTLNLARQSQSTISGAFNWSHKAQSRLVDRKAEPEWALVGEHDGYVKRFGARHRRRVAKNGAAILIQDCLLGTAQDAEIVFQLASGLEAELGNGSVLVSRAGRAILTLDLPPGEVRIVAGGDVPGQGGWVSPCFGSKVPAPRIGWSGRVDAAGVVTRLWVPGH